MKGVLIGMWSVWDLFVRLSRVHLLDQACTGFLPPRHSIDNLAISFDAGWPREGTRMLSMLQYL
jgi:hypothetical protein